MDRRTFLARATLAIGGGVVGGALARLPAVDRQRRLAAPQDVADRSYATDHWGDPALGGVDVIWRVQTNDKLIALTFDDGPVPANTVAVLDILQQKRCPATFNLVGRRAVDHADLVTREMRGRHEIGNHTWSHRDLSLISPGDVEKEVRLADEAIERLTGRRPRFFRPPKGDLPGDALAMAARLDYSILMWSLQLHESAFDAAGNTRYVVDNLQPGTILLAHDTGNATRKVGLAALPSLIDEVRRQGYECVTMSDLLAAGTPAGPRQP